MHVSQPVPAKPDDLLGVCAAIGDDLGFDPNYLRVALSAGILWNPVVVLAAYAVMALVVLGTRLLFPDAKVAVAEPVATLPEAANAEEPKFALAA